MIKSYLYLTLLALLSFGCGGNETATEPENNPPAPQAPLKAELAYQASAQLGEGALWDYQQQRFYWIDIEGKQLHLFDPAAESNQTFDLPSRVGTVVPVDAQTALVALEDGIYSIDLSNGKLTDFSDVERERTENRFNDGKCDPAGRLWVGSMHLEQSEPAASLYMVEGDGSYKAMFDSVTISNGIVWTRDGKTMYYIDTPRGHILGFDYDVETGEISNQRVSVEVPDSLGYPDGMAIDEEDKLWVGMWNGHAVARFDPVKGELMERIQVPAKNVTACAFGGASFDTLYITTASVDMTEAERASLPLAGSVFIAVPGVKGVATPYFAMAGSDAR